MITQRTLSFSLVKHVANMYFICFNKYDWANIVYKLKSYVSKNFHVETLYFFLVPELSPIWTYVSFDDTQFVYENLVYLVLLFCTNLKLNEH